MSVKKPECFYAGWLKKEAGLVSMRVAVAGHVTYDTIYHEELSLERVLGGSATYASLSLAKLFTKPILASRVGWDFSDGDLALISSLTDSHVLRSRSSTTRFELRYINGRRELKLLARCDPLSEDDLRMLRDADLVILGSVAGEIEPGLAREVAEAASFTAAGLQGFLRRFNSNGWAYLMYSQEALESLKNICLICGSSEEVMTLAGVDRLEKALRRLVDLGFSCIAATMGELGSWMVVNGALLKAPCYPTPSIIDPTGAGDVYMATLAYMLSRGEDPAWSMSMASAAASFNIEAVGPIYQATLSEVEERGAFIAELVESSPL